MFDLIYKTIVHCKLQLDLLNRYVDDYLKYNSPQSALIYDALKTSLLIKLGKILDDDSTRKSITIFYILNTIQSDKIINNKNQDIIKYAEKSRENIIDKYGFILSKIKTTRDKTIAHLDKKYIEGYHSLKYNDALTVYEIKEIIYFLLDLLNNLKKQLYNENGNGKQIFDCTVLNN